MKISGIVSDAGPASHTRLQARPGLFNDYSFGAGKAVAGKFHVFIKETGP